LQHIADSLQQLADIVHTQGSFDSSEQSPQHFQFELDQSELYLPFAFDHSIAAAAFLLVSMLVVVDKTFL